MLISFAVRNHRSIEARQVLSLEATSDSHLAESRVLEAGPLRLLRSIALYGPNASGKSNVLGALRRMKWLVLASPPSAQVNDPIPVEPFRLTTASEEAPSEFQVEFWLEGHRYRYGFEADSQAVRTEWLMRRGKGKEAVLFLREGQDIKVGQPHFSEGRERRRFVLPNVLFLPLCARLNGEVSGKVVGWFQRLRFLSGLNDVAMLYDTAKRLLDPAHNAVLGSFARHADPTIRSMTSEEFDPVKAGLRLPSDMSETDRQRVLGQIAMHDTEIKTRHPVFGADGAEAGTVEFDLKKDASEGTKKFVALSGPLHMAIEEDAVLVVDEFEARLHPLLTQAVLEWFHGPHNPSRAQLVLATHDVLLMEPERIRRDQVWFCEKDERGATHLYSLAEFDPQDVRSTTKFGRQYLLGLFGAVPQLAMMRGEPVRNEPTPHA